MDNFQSNSLIFLQYFSFKGYGPFGSIADYYVQCTMTYTERKLNIIFGF